MTQDATADYATWTEPGTSFQVHYSLPVFHDIDLAVSEGYRRIPHGGIEIGGLLFGRRFPDGVRIEAFRGIDCEHALGPAFKLSERDVNGLRQQIANRNGDPELGELETLGWFISHTRGPLQLTEPESRLFDDLLPGAGMVTVLVKPEKFKPTLFAFLIRGRNGTVEVSGADRAIILPLPGRAGRGPAGPATTTPAEPPAARTDLQAAPIAQPAPVEPAWLEPAPISAPSWAEPLVSPPPPFEWDFDRTPVEQPVVEPLFDEPIEPGGRGIIRDSKREGKSPGTLILVILVAAILGASAGYWMYQQMSPAIIQLTVEPQRNGVIVSWPHDQTDSASHAFIRVNDGPAMELPPYAKAAGRWQVLGEPDNLKVELVAQHTLRDSRGIVRYIQPAPGS